MKVSEASNLVQSQGRAMESLLLEFLVGEVMGMSATEVIDPTGAGPGLNELLRPS